MAVESEASTSGLALSEVNINWDREREAHRHDDSVAATSKNPNLTSEVWKYFDQVKRRKFLCREENPHYNRFLKRSNDSSTSNFWRHLFVKHKAIHDKLKGIENKDKLQTPDDVLSLNKWRNFALTSFEKMKDMVCRYVCKLDQPWLALNDPDFRNLLRHCAQEHVKISSWKTIREHALLMYQREKAQLKQMLLGVRRVSLTVDSWTSDNWVALVGVTVHWIDEEWKLCEWVLTLTQLQGENTREHLAMVLFISLKEFSLEKKICAVMTNNVSDNKTMISALATTLGSLNPDFNRTSHLLCLAHVFNLAVQDGFRHLHVSSPATVTDSTSASLEENDTFLNSSQSLSDVVTRIRQVVRAI